MLSANEYNKIKWQLEHIPETITGKPRQNLRALLKKKLHEHELASRFPPFKPYNYRQFFINYKTSAQTLHHLIDTVKNSTSFTLDTESICIYKQPNKPALIQLQVLQENLFSYVIFIEVCHLPHKDEQTFKLIQQLFIYLFDSYNDIYVWGSIDELDKFLKFNLFSSNQIHLSNNVHLQNDFKDYWHKHHPHQSISSLTTNNISCICEECLGIQLNNPWSIQDAVAYKLNQWLDKRYTISSFDIGLDPTLVHLNSNEIKHRNTITKYAANDCLAIQQLLIHMNILDNQQRARELLQQPELITSIDQDLSFNIPSTPSFTNIPPQQQSVHEPYEDISSDDNNEQQQSQPPRTILIDMNYSKRELIDERQHELIDERQRELIIEHQHELIDEHQQKLINNKQHNPLTIEERKKIHNRSTTLKQRIRSYKHEIIQRHIDKRFTISDIKNVLRQNSIKFTAINTSTSSTTNDKSLYIGIKNEHLLETYKEKTKELFTTANYKEYKRTSRSSNKKDDRYKHEHRRH